MGALAVSGLDSVFLAVSGLTSGLLAARGLYFVFLEVSRVSRFVAASWLDSGLLAVSWTMLMVRSARRKDDSSGTFSKRQTKPYTSK